MDDSIAILPHLQVYWQVQVIHSWWLFGSDLRSPLYLWPVERLCCPEIKYDLRRDWRQSRKIFWCVAKFIDWSTAFYLLDLLNFQGCRVRCHFWKRNRVTFPLYCNSVVFEALLQNWPRIRSANCCFLKISGRLLEAFQIQLFWLIRCHEIA